jgi:cytochrome b561
MDNIVVIYALKILRAIGVIIFMLLVSKIIAGIVRRRIINGDPENKHIQKVGKLMHDITFYLLMVFSFFIGFEMMGFNVGLILG